MVDRCYIDKESGVLIPECWGAAMRWHLGNRAARDACTCPPRQSHKDLESQIEDLKARVAELEALLTDHVRL